MKILLLCHKSLIPPKRGMSARDGDIQPWRTENSVACALKRLGHHVVFCGVTNSLRPLKKLLETSSYDVVFNLLEEFSGEGLLESVVVSFLESIKQPFTGCNSIGLILSKNKAAAKAILREMNIKVPGSEGFPKIVKLVDEESSLGITSGSVVYNDAQLNAQVSKIKSRYSDRIMLESYIDGRELHVGVLQSDGKLFAAEICETTFGSLPGEKIISEKVKWNFAYRKKMGIDLVSATDISEQLADRIKSEAVRGCKALSISGYARVDVRLNQEGEPYVIEVNPNPDVALGDEFAASAEGGGLNYDDLINQIVREATRGDDFKTR